MRAVVSHVRVRRLARGDAAQTLPRIALSKDGAWVSQRVLAETVRVLDAVYKRSAAPIATAMERLLDHKPLTLQDAKISREPFLAPDPRSGSPIAWCGKSGARQDTWRSARSTRASRSCRAPHACRRCRVVPANRGGRAGPCTSNRRLETPRSLASHPKQHPGWNLVRNDASRIESGPDPARRCVLDVKADAGSIQRMDPAGRF
jgi:hypothetical protein